MQNRLALIFILLTVTIDSIGIGIIFPVLPDLIETVTGRPVGESALWGGVLATAFALMQFLFGPVIGNVSDRYGRRPIMLIALAIMALDYLVMAVAQTIWLLVIGRVVAGITAATYATATAYIADISKPSERAKSFGLIGAGFGIGFVLGPLLGGILSTIDLRAPFWAAAAIAGANLVFGFFVLPESLAPEKRRSFSWRRANPLAAFRAIGNLPGLRPYLWVIFVFTVAFQSYPSIWSFYGKARFGWDAWWIGMSLAFYGIAMALVQAFLVGPAIRLWGERKTTIYGLTLDIAGFVFYGFVTSGFWAIAVTPILTLSGVAAPALQGILSNATPDDQQGELQGVLSSIAAVGMSVSPMVMTAVFFFFTREGAAIYSPGAPFLLSALLMVVCVLILVVRPRARVPA
jgi:DHA1 family tetracycline resistance protein-like MFS transporter